MAKNYIISQLCIKNLIFRLNDLEKLKLVIFSDDQFRIFENIDNPPFDRLNFINKNKIESIWKDIKSNSNETIQTPFNDLYIQLKNKKKKNNIDSNLINLIEKIGN